MDCQRSVLDIGITPGRSVPARAINSRLRASEAVAGVAVLAVPSALGTFAQACWNHLDKVQHVHYIGCVNADHRQVRKHCDQDVRRRSQSTAFPCGDARSRATVTISDLSMLAGEMDRRSLE